MKRYFPCPLSFVGAALVLIPVFLAQAQEPAAATVSADTVQVAPPTGDAETDRANVKAAFDAVQPGGTVQFAPGTYVVGGEGLVLRTPGVTLQGHPGGSTLLGCAPEDTVGSSEDTCGDGLVLAAGLQRVTGLRFESFSTALAIEEPAAPVGTDHTAPGSGGHLIERNSFRNSGSVSIALDADSAVVVRDNAFENMWHAVSLRGRNLAFIENDISAPEPGEVPQGYPGGAVGISQDRSGNCESILVARNHIDGYTEGVMLILFPMMAPGAKCSAITVRDNDISMRSVRIPFENPNGGGHWNPQRAGKLAIAPAIRVINLQRLVHEGVSTWLDPLMPEGGWPSELSKGRISGVLVESNRISGAVGVGIEAVYVTESRISNNEVEVRPAVEAEELEGLVAGGNARAGIWVVLGLLDDVNGTPVWVSEGSERTFVEPPR